MDNAMGKTLKTESSLIVNVVSEKYPKGKQYIFNGCSSEITSEQIILVMLAFKNVIDGTIIGYKIRKTDTHELPESI